MIDKVQGEHKFKFLRLEILERLETLKEEVIDMGAYVEDDLKDEDINDEDLIKVNDKIKELEKQIVEIIERK